MSLLIITRPSDMSSDPYLPSKYCICHCVCLSRYLLSLSQARITIHYPHLDLPIQIKSGSSARMFRLNPRIEGEQLDGLRTQIRISVPETDREAHLSGLLSTMHLVGTFSVVPNLAIPQVCSIGAKDESDMRHLK